jgi:hypothetical protein
VATARALVVYVSVICDWWESRLRLPVTAVSLTSALRDALAVKYSGSPAAWQRPADWLTMKGVKIAERHPMADVRKLVGGWASNST